MKRHGWITEGERFCGRLTRVEQHTVDVALEHERVPHAGRILASLD